MKRYRAVVILLAVAAAVWIVRIVLVGTDKWWLILPADTPQRIAALRDRIMYNLFPPDRPKAVRITCENNLKQIGLALRIWSGDNGDFYPFNLSTNQGGSLEWCYRDTNGFDLNAWRHLLPMSNELNSPKVLVCPKDKRTKAATSWLTFGPSNVTYRVRTGTNVNELNPRAVVVVCPVCGTTCYADGGVTPGR